MTKERVLLCVDDEFQILKSLERGLRKENYTLITTTSTSEALEILAKQKVHVVISDYRMQEMTGLDLLKKIRVLAPDVVRVILSGYADEALIRGALDTQDVHHYLLKPWEVDELKMQINGFFGEYSAKQERGVKS